MSEAEPVGQVGFLESDKERDIERGEEIAELYVQEQEDRAEDDPLRLQKRDGGTASAEGEEGAAATSGYPGTHAKLDELAAANGYEWSGASGTVAEKQAELEAAGIAPE